MIGKSSLMSRLLFMVSVLVHLNTIKSTQFVEYNYTFDVPQIKLNTLYLSKTEQLKIYQGELLKQFLIRQPKEIGDVYQVQIFPKNLTLKEEDGSNTDQNNTEKDQPKNKTIKGKQLDDNVIEELNETSLKGVWFESFLWPIKQKSCFYSLQKQQLNSKQQKQLIISVAHSSPKQKSTDFNDSKVFPLYVLLSSGKIQVVQNEYEMLKAKKQYTQFGSTSGNFTSNIPFWTDAYLYHKHGRLYLLIEEHLYAVSLTQTDQGGLIKRFFSLQSIGLDNIREVIEDGPDLYAFTEDASYKITDNTFELTIKFSDIFSTFNISDARLIDVAIYNNNFYFLQHPLGIIKYSQRKQFELLRIQHPEMARKVNVFQRTIFVTYQVGADNYIQEYQFFPEGQKLFANKIFDYHSDEQVKDVLLYENYMVINRGPQLILGVHSLNRKFPSKFHFKSQILMLNFFLDQIYELRTVRFSFFDPPSYLVVGPHQVQLIKFELNPDQQMQQKWIKIGSQKTGIFEFDVKYTGNFFNSKGTCKQSHYYPSQYCSIKNSIQLIVTDIVGEEIHSWWIWVCLAVVGLILSIIAWILAWRYFSKKQNEFESLASSRRSQTIGGITMVQMQAEKQTDEKTETD